MQLARCPLVAKEAKTEEAMEGIMRPSLWEGKLGPGFRGESHKEGGYLSVMKTHS